MPGSLRREFFIKKFSFRPKSVHSIQTFLSNCNEYPSNIKWETYSHQKVEDVVPHIPGCENRYGERIALLERLRVWEPITSAASFLPSFLPWPCRGYAVVWAVGMKRAEISKCDIQLEWGHFMHVCLRHTCTFCFNCTNHVVYSKHNCALCFKNTHRGGNVWEIISRNPMWAFPEPYLYQQTKRGVHLQVTGSLTFIHINKRDDLPLSLPHWVLVCFTDLSGFRVLNEWTYCSV